MPTISVQGERGRVVAKGMGGFLNPPNHPEHTHSVETDLRRRPWNRGRMCLSSATGCEWLRPETRAQAKACLERWEKLPIDHPDVIAWIRQVLGYFRHCYRNRDLAEPECWHASNVIIAPTPDPMMDPDNHCGVHLIRKYYPEYQPTAEDFALAKWGS